MKAHDWQSLTDYKAAYLLHLGVQNEDLHDALSGVATKLRQFCSRVVHLDEVTVLVLEFYTLPFDLRFALCT